MKHSSKVGVAVVLGVIFLLLCMQAVCAESHDLPVVTSGDVYVYCYDNDSGDFICSYIETVTKSGCIYPEYLSGWEATSGGVYITFNKSTGQCSPDEVYFYYQFARDEPISPYPGEVIATKTATYEVNANGKNLTLISGVNMYGDDPYGKFVIPEYVKVNGKKMAVTKIAESALKNETGITVVTIGKKVTSIGANAFRGCMNLRKVTGGVGLLTIGKYAFYSCKNLESFYLQSTKLKTIGVKAFCNCKSLESIIIPVNVTTIGKQAFYGCNYLGTITIKTKKLTASSIGYNAFGGKVYVCRDWTVPSSKYTLYRKYLKKSNATDVY